MLIHVGVLQNAYLVTILRKASGDVPAFVSEEQEGVAPAQRPVSAKLNACVYGEADEVVRVLRGALGEARRTRDPDDGPLVGHQGSLLEIDDGLVAALVFYTVDSGVMVRSVEPIEVPAPRVVFENGKQRVIMAGSAGGAGTLGVESLMHGFHGADEALEWTTKFLHELREAAEKELAKAANVDEEE